MVAENKFPYTVEKPFAAPVALPVRQSEHSSAGIYGPTQQLNFGPESQNFQFNSVQDHPHKNHYQNNYNNPWASNLQDAQAFDLTPPPVSSVSDTWSSQFQNTQKSQQQFGDYSTFFKAPFQNTQERLDVKEHLSTETTLPSTYEVQKILEELGLKSPSSPSKSKFQDSQAEKHLKYPKKSSIVTPQLTPHKIQDYSFEPFPVTGNDPWPSESQRAQDVSFKSSKISSYGYPLSTQEEDHGLFTPDDSRWNTDHELPQALPLKSFQESDPWNSHVDTIKEELGLQTNELRSLGDLWKSSQKIEDFTLKSPDVTVPSNLLSTYSLNTQYRLKPFDIEEQIHPGGAQSYSNYNLGQRHPDITDRRPWRENLQGSQDQGSTYSKTDFNRVLKQSKDVNS